MPKPLRARDSVDMTAAAVRESDSTPASSCGRARIVFAPTDDFKISNTASG
jgi:hypothetical protein